MWDTSIGLGLNFLIIYIQDLLFSVVQNFNPFSCWILSYFHWVSEWVPKPALLKLHILTYWIPIWMWDTSISLWVHSLIIYIQDLFLSEVQNCNLFRLLNFRYISLKRQCYQIPCRSPILFYSNTTGLCC